MAGVQCLSQGCVEATVPAWGCTPELWSPIDFPILHVFCGGQWDSLVVWVGQGLFLLFSFGTDHWIAFAIPLVPVMSMPPSVLTRGDGKTLGGQARAALWLSTQVLLPLLPYDKGCPLPQGPGGDPPCRQSQDVPGRPTVCLLAMHQPLPSVLCLCSSGKRTGLETTLLVWHPHDFFC